MFQRRNFGKAQPGQGFGRLGKRSAARMDIAIAGKIATTGQTTACRIENVSREGCCLRLENPPPVGSDILIRVERAERIGELLWQRGGRCGIRFADPLNPGELRRLRWIIDNPEKHARNSVHHATAMWR